MTSSSNRRRVQPVPAAPAKGQTPAARSGSVSGTATKAEVEALISKISGKALKDPAKGARILTDWLSRPAQKNQRPSRKRSA